MVIKTLMYIVIPNVKTEHVEAITNKMPKNVVTNTAREVTDGTGYDTGFRCIYFTIPMELTVEQFNQQSFTSAIAEQNTIFRDLIREVVGSDIFEIQLHVEPEIQATSCYTKNGASMFCDYRIKKQGF